MSSEPEVIELDDEVGDIPLLTPAGPSESAEPDVPSPMAELPTGAKFGSLVHAVLENADPLAADLTRELRDRVDEHSVVAGGRSGRCAGRALVPMHDTLLGPLADNLTLRQSVCGTGCARWTSNSPWAVAICATSAGCSVSTCPPVTC